eukprot:TRINITY_DN1543_c0_g1_i1.p2 TRINITY_DN1543_c0_g1~~TRINITY_DN1543_c0_g1_i1.p2  ORF type:complete len:149 (+),score=11.75 TRINITY_DN1543_c0_g1_i1:1138-1584(+)
MKPIFRSVEHISLRNADLRQKLKMKFKPPKAFTETELDTLLEIHSKRFEEIFFYKGCMWEVDDPFTSFAWARKLRRVETGMDNHAPYHDLSESPPTVLCRLQLYHPTALSTEGVLSNIGLYRSFMMRIVIWGLTEIDNMISKKEKVPN